MATIRPVLDMMPFQEETVFTSWIPTGRIALAQRALERPGDRAALAPDRQRRTLLVLHDLDDAGITAEPARNLAGHERVAQLAYLDRIHRPAAQAARRNRERDLDRRSLWPITAQIALCERHQRVCAAECTPRCISALAQRARRAVCPAVQRRPGGARRQLLVAR